MDFELMEFGTQTVTKSYCIAIKDKIPPLELNCDATKRRTFSECRVYNILCTIPVLVDWFLYCIFPVKDAEYKIMYVDWFCGLEN
ncbi:hypothetical protein KY289_007433 [Solanum tuberosum]|nr:hypothetical protein KY289_007433 [Solanum tuberosum]